MIVIHEDDYMDRDGSRHSDHLYIDVYEHSDDGRQTEPVDNVIIRAYKLGISCTCFNNIFRAVFFDREVDFLAKNGSIIANWFCITIIGATIPTVLGLMRGHHPFVSVLTIIISGLSITLTQFTDMLVEKHYLKTQQQIHAVREDIEKLDNKLDTKMDEVKEEIGVMSNRIVRIESNMNDLKVAIMGIANYIQQSQESKQDEQEDWVWGDNDVSEV